MKTNSASMEALFDAFADTLKDTLINGKTVVDKDGEVQSITPDSASLSVIRQFLKDQNITVAPGTNNVVNDIASNLPFNGEEYDVDTTLN